MRLDRGLPKGREGLTEREQQPHTSMGGSPGRLTGQRHQARYHLVVIDGMYISPCKLNFCAQISLASVVDAVACSNVSTCMPSVCVTAFSEPHISSMGHISSQRGISAQWGMSPEWGILPVQLYAWALTGRRRIYIFTQPTMLAHVSC